MSLVRMWPFAPRSIDVIGIVLNYCIFDAFKYKSHKISLVNFSGPLTKKKNIFPANLFIHFYAFHITACHRLLFPRKTVLLPSIGTPANLFLICLTLKKVLVVIFTSGAASRLKGITASLATKIFLLVVGDSIYPSLFSTYRFVYFIKCALETFKKTSLFISLSLSTRSSEIVSNATIGAFTTLLFSCSCFVIRRSQQNPVENFVVAIFIVYFPLLPVGHVI